MKQYVWSSLGLPKRECRKHCQGKGTAGSYTEWHSQLSCFMSMKVLSA